MSTAMSLMLRLTRENPTTIWFSEMKKDLARVCSSLDSSSLRRSLLLVFSSAITTASYTTSWWKWGTPRSLSCFSASFTSPDCKYSLSVLVMFSVRWVRAPLLWPQMLSRKAMPWRMFTRVFAVLTISSALGLDRSLCSAKNRGGRTSSERARPMKCARWVGASGTSRARSSTDARSRSNALTSRASFTASSLIFTSSLDTSSRSLLRASSAFSTAMAAAATRPWALLSTSRKFSMKSSMSWLLKYSSTRGSNALRSSLGISSGTKVSNSTSASTSAPASSSLSRASSAATEADLPLASLSGP
eukprot:comp19331_c0_seq1/m.22241 comp19331_c0_seq1/g.22241  ORF comp19331_c0_seq1/g.22241 comp19331_c0_seq1/m.22241 type:complete len:303 (+) comp19331_c0_seq1:740-1648(+)